MQGCGGSYGVGWGGSCRGDMTSINEFPHITSMMSTPSYLIFNQLVNFLSLFKENQLQIDVGALSVDWPLLGLLHLLVNWGVQCPQTTNDTVACVIQIYSGYTNHCSGYSTVLTLTCICAQTHP